MPTNPNNPNNPNKKPEDTRNKPTDAPRRDQDRDTSRTNQPTTPRK